MYDPEKREYLGARNARFAIFPGSSLFKKSPRWVMAAELVETSRLWGRVAARIEPEWIEELATHLVKRSYSEPHWSKAEESVVAYEKVTLYGIPIVAQRKVHYGKIDPELSRELFIRHALVYGEWTTKHQFFHDNRKLLKEVEELENRARRRGIVVDDETLFDFYDQRVGADVTSARHFDTWWKKARQDAPDLLSFEREMLVNENAAAVTEEQYPNLWRQGKLRFKLTYQFEPGADADGVTVHIPLAVLNQVEPDGLRLADPRPARGAGHRADPLAAQADPAQLRPRAELREGAAGEAPGARGRPAGRPRARDAPDGRARPRPLATGIWSGCPST